MQAQGGTFGLLLPYPDGFQLDGSSKHAVFFRRMAPSRGRTDRNRRFCNKEADVAWHSTGRLRSARQISCAYSGPLAPLQ